MTQLREGIERVACQDKIASAITAVREPAPFGEDEPTGGPMLTSVAGFDAADADAPILATAMSLADLAGRRRLCGPDARSRGADSAAGSPQSCSAGA